MTVTAAPQLRHASCGPADDQPSGVSVERDENQRMRQIEERHANYAGIGW
ncbi:MAG: hypothetical protein ACRES6_05880 [Steroidobacteraceae bacterium]